jgi:hypothetical protein
MSGLYSLWGALGPGFGIWRHYPSVGQFCHFQVKIQPKSLIRRVRLEHFYAGPHCHYSVTCNHRLQSPRFFRKICIKHRITNANQVITGNLTSTIVSVDTEISDDCMLCHSVDIAKPVYNRAEILSTEVALTSWLEQRVDCAGLLPTRHMCSIQWGGWTESDTLEIQYMLFVQFTIYIDQIVSPNQLVVLDPYDAIVLVGICSIYHDTKCCVSSAGVRMTTKWSRCPLSQVWLRH